MKMDPKVKAAWIERLRSGNIPQLTGYLGNEAGERCCLGVLCDLALDGEVISVREPMLDADRHLRYGIAGTYEDDDDFEETGLPRAVASWGWNVDVEPDSSLSVDGVAAIDHPEYGNIHLAVLNDGAGQAEGSSPHIHSRTKQPIVVPKHTFAQIADLIEEHL